MQKISVAHRVFLAVFVLLLSGCGDSGSNNSNSDVQVNETGTSEKSYTEIVHLNNCGGTANSEQTKSRSVSTDFGGGIDVSVPYVRTTVNTKYGNNASVSQKLTAPPATNMEFVLKWSEEVHAGEVTVNGETGTYTASIPIAVEQVSSRDLGCNESGTSDSSSDSPVPISATCGYDGESLINVNDGQDIYLYGYLFATTKEYLQDYLDATTFSLQFDGEKTDFYSLATFDEEGTTDSGEYYVRWEYPAIKLRKGTYQVDLTESYNRQFTDGYNSYEAGDSYNYDPPCKIIVE